MKTRKNLPIYSHILVAILSSFLWHIASADEGLPLDDCTRYSQSFESI